MTVKKSALGRGLSALIEDANYEKRQVEEILKTSINEIDIEKVESNPFQPRKDFSEDSLNELAQSIKELGIIQPITIRHIENDRYQLISGERRLKAAKIAGLTKIHAFIREANDQAMLEMALVENIQREDLNSLDIAMSYQRLIEECNLTHEVLSDRVGKNRTTISNFLRLLKLPAEIQIGLRDNKISMGHAKNLINIEDPEIQLIVYNTILEKSLSVRQTEEFVRKDIKQPKPSVYINKDELPQDYKDFMFSLKSNLHTKVEINRSQNGKGKIVIQFNSDTEFKRLSEIFNKIN